MQDTPPNGHSVPSVVDAINPQIMRRVVGDEPEMIQILISEFLPGARCGIAEIREAAASGVADRVGSASHKLKGACAMVGAKHLIDTCLRLEAAARTQDWTRIGELLTELDPRMTEVESAAQLLLQQMPEH
ncbi:MAG: Hpt domain-containing protein [Candidatus Acidiferrales bacterium]